jgi:hypothetical protein
MDLGAEMHIDDPIVANDLPVDDVVLPIIGFRRRNIERVEFVPGLVDEHEILLGILGAGGHGKGKHDGGDSGEQLFHGTPR